MWHKIDVIETQKRRSQETRKIILRLRLLWLPSDVSDCEYRSSTCKLQRSFKMKNFLISTISNDRLFYSYIIFYHFIVHNIHIIFLITNFIWSKFTPMIYILILICLICTSYLFIICNNFNIPL